MAVSSPLRILFFGTPEFAVHSLDALVKAGYPIVAVITAVDKEAGRGRKIQASAVKQYALKAGLPIQQPRNLKDPAFLEWLGNQEVDLGVVVAFRMLPREVWSYPRRGTLNIHGSLLPDYRGAAPINWAIMGGETETGLTSFMLKHEIDTGDLLLQQRIPIHPEDDFGSLYEKMGPLSGQLLIQTLEGLENGTLQPRPQGEPRPGTEAPKLFRHHGQIDWSRPAGQIHNQIRGLSPIPGAFTEWEGKTLKIFRSRLGERITVGIQTGQGETDGKSRLRFAAADRWLEVLELQMEGRQRMETADFLRGYRSSTETK